MIGRDTERIAPELRPHRRYDPLRDQWVLVSPQRSERPWQGQVEKASTERKPRHDPTCYLCPGNERAGGAVNPDYRETFVFTNDYPALLPAAGDEHAGHEHAGDEQVHASGLFRSAATAGTSRVICFSPRHDLTFAQLTAGDIRRVVELWCEQTAELGERHRWVQLFENKGAMMGASNPHPHGQVWALDALPTEAARELATQRAHHARVGTPMLLDYARAELVRGDRVVESNEHWLALVPYWATWPFELLLVPHARHVARINELDPAERLALAELCKLAFSRLDNLFETPFPYSFGWHGAPFQPSRGATTASAEPGLNAWQLHAHVYPPLLRSATVRKFMVGFELLAEPQRDLTPEQAAERIRSVSPLRYGSEDGDVRGA